jgi:hypothetical protein
VRVRDHLVLSAAGTVLLRPWTHRSALGLIAGGVLIDADHYAWFCLRHRRLNPATAIRFFNGADPPRHPGTRLLHTPGALVAALAAGLRWPRLLPVAVGMGLHVALDARHEARLGQARAAALERDEFCCQSCGSPGAPAASIETHIRHQPWLLPSYAAHDLISLCHGCHETAHARRRGPGPWI